MKKNNKKFNLFDAHDRAMYEIGKIINADNKRIDRAIKKLQEAKIILTSDYATDISVCAMLVFQIQLLEKTKATFEDRYVGFEKLYGVKK